MVVSHRQIFDFAVGDGFTLCDLISKILRLESFIEAAKRQVLSLDGLSQVQLGGSYKEIIATGAAAMAQHGAHRPHNGAVIGKGYGASWDAIAENCSILTTHGIFGTAADAGSLPANQAAIESYWHEEISQPLASNDRLTTLQGISKLTAMTIRTFHRHFTIA